MFRYLVFALSLTQCIQAKCPDDCKKLTSVYEDIKCKPIYDKPQDCCPIKYDCSHINKKPAGKCVFQDKIYNDREEVPSNLTYGACEVACRCDGGKFTCAILDCPEYLGIHPPPGCVHKYEINKCCSVGKICTPFDGLAKCEVDGKTYYEGQRFTPTNDGCLECVCQKGFKGDFVEPFCQKRRCLTELRHTSDLEKNCAVVYNTGNKCCPYTFQCPESGTPTILAARVGEEGPSCVYGRDDIKFGDKFEDVEVISDYHKIETKCECSVPPLVTCVRKDVYDLDKAPPHIRLFHMAA